MVARNVLVETGGVGVYAPGLSNLRATKRGEQDKSPKKFESSESGRERGIAVNWSNASKASQSIGAHFGRIRAAISFGERDAQNERFRDWLLVLLRPAFQQLLFKSCIYSSIQVNRRNPYDPRLALYKQGPALNV
jgi:hypothetical protein